MEKAFKKLKDGRLLTPIFRVSFPHVFEPHKESGKYSLGMLFDEDVDFSELDKAIKKEIKNRWGDQKPKKLMLPVLDGDESDREDYEGYMYINGKCGKYKPGLVDQNKEKIDDPEEFYPGCYARATIKLYAWDYMGSKKGISVAVDNIQKCADGDPFVSRVSADDDFDDIPTDDDADDL